MSAAGIMKIIHLHTGANASDTVKIPHAQVEEMIAQATEGGKTTAEERVLLLEALYTFGGNMVHPSIFESQADIDALAGTAMHGIETPALFAGLTKEAQYTFLYNGVFIGGGEKVGFSQAQTLLLALSAAAQETIAALVASSYKTAGSKTYNSDAVPQVISLIRGGEAYGYQVTFSFSAKDDSGYYEEEAMLGPGGILLHGSGSFEPIDRD
jgi:hypothetical protein